MADSTGLSEQTRSWPSKLNTLPASVDSTMGVYLFLLTGLGAPWWDDSARGRGV